MPLTKRAKANPDQGDFFIPDLCAPQPTLLMILAMELLVLVYVLAASRLPQFNWDLFALASLFVQWILLSSAWLLCQCRHRLSQFSLPVVTLISLALVSSTTLLSSAVIQVYLADLIGLDKRPGWLLRNLLIANVLAAMLLRYFYLQQQLGLREQWALQARLDALRARIRPHFLFNTLNSIASLIDSRPEQAEQAVVNLAELLRASLKEDHHQTTLQDEIHLTELYLGIEHLRLGERLSVHWDIDERLLDKPMPSLIIQPLAENAIQHGVARLAEGGLITISIAQESNQLLTRVTNPVPGQESDTSGHQMALKYVEQRLQGEHGTEASLRILRDKNLFQVELRYPLEIAS